MPSGHVENLLSRLPEMSSASLGGVVGAFCLAWVVRRYFQVRASLKALGDHPGIASLIPSNPAYDIFPSVFGRIALLYRDIWAAKHTDYEKAGWDAITVISYVPPRVGVFVADPNVIKKVGASRAMFPKQIELYAVLQFYGENVVTVEGDEWSAHRKLANPGFTEKNNVLVWEETVRITEEMLEEWGSADYSVSNVVDITKEVALLVISAAAFGQEVHWTDDPHPPKGHIKTFREAVAQAGESLLIRVATPDFLWGSTETRSNIRVGGLAGNGWLGKQLQEAAVSFAELQVYMEEMVENQRTSGAGNRGDLFSQLLQAYDEDGGDSGVLSLREVFGNTFIFLIAGHETTAHSLAYLFGLLALEEATQEKLYQQIKDTLGERLPTYEDISSLNFILAAFYEALRLYPPVADIPKVVAQDVTVTVGAAVDSKGNVMSPNGQPTKNLFLPAGTELRAMSVGLHYNPKYWDEPFEFRPERFLKSDWPRDAFIPFSSGQRSCIGRRFAEIEAIAFITLILHKYQVQIDGTKFADVPGETKFERRERLLAGSQLLTFTPKQIPLKFVRR